MTLPTTVHTDPEVEAIRDAFQLVESLSKLREKQPLTPAQEKVHTTAREVLILLEAI